MINYDLNKVMYTSAAPATLFEYNLLAAMVPYLAAAVLSFTVAALISRSLRTEAEPEEDLEKEAETEKTEAEAKQEADFDSIIT